MTFEALVSGPEADNSTYVTDRPVYVYPAAEAHDREGRLFGDHLPPERIQVPGYDGVRRHFYVLRDPDVPSAAIMARSVRDAAEFRTRAIPARVLSAPPDGPVLLVELAGMAAVPSDSPQRRPAEVSVQDQVITLIGRFSDGRPATCPPGDETVCPEGQVYSYTVTDDDGGEVSVISPHAPDRLPVRLTGIMQWDPSALDAIYAERQVIAALDGAVPPGSWLIEDGASPIFQEASFADAIVLGALAAVLLGSWLAARARDRLSRRRRAAVT